MLLYLGSMTRPDPLWKGTLIMKATPNTSCPVPWLSSQSHRINFFYGYGVACLSKFVSNQQKLVIAKISIFQANLG